MGSNLITRRKSKFPGFSINRPELHRMLQEQGLYDDLADWLLLQAGQLKRSWPARFVFHLPAASRRQPLPFWEVLKDGNRKRSENLILEDLVNAGSVTDTITAFRESLIRGKERAILYATYVEGLPDDSAEKDMKYFLNHWSIDLGRLGQRVFDRCPSARENSLLTGYWNRLFSLIPKEHYSVLNPLGIDRKTRLRATILSATDACLDENLGQLKLTPRDQERVDEMVRANVQDVMVEESPYDLTAQNAGDAILFELWHCLDRKVRMRKCRGQVPVSGRPCKGSRRARLTKTCSRAFIPVNIGQQCCRACFRKGRTSHPKCS